MGSPSQAMHHDLTPDRSARTQAKHLEAAAVQICRLLSPRERVVFTNTLEAIDDGTCQRQPGIVLSDFPYPV